MVCRRACRQRSAWPGCPRVAGCVDRPEHRERCRRPLSAHATRVGSKALGRRDLHLQARLRQAESPGNQGDHRRAASWRNRARFCCARTEQNVNDAADANHGRPGQPLCLGWTTGACATAATRAAYEALVTGECPDPVEIGLPGGARVRFAVAGFEIFDGGATAGIVKDAGDDPDVTHGALIKATVRAGTPGSGVTFAAGEGVGTVTKPGLPIPAGEPAINPVPREAMRAAVRR